MESAALTKAHEHVRTAATATYANSIVQAGRQHELAAAAFHDAAQDTHNSEALRILNLLQDHHRTLAGLIKEAPRATDPKATEAKNNKSKDTADARQVKEPKEALSAEAAGHPPASTAASHNRSTPRTASPSTASSPTRAPRRRLPQSSIASNLAEARGIGPRRGAPTSSVSGTNAWASRNEQAPTPVRDMLSRKTDASKSSEASRSLELQERNTPAPAQPSHTEDNFRRFYSTFGSIISAISPPLAFTSLPLTFSNAPPPAEPPKEAKPPQEQKATRKPHYSPESSRTVKSSEPDLAALISKPALRALAEDGSAPMRPNESFYLVPTSGGTVSYASILQNPGGHPHLAPITEADGDAGSGLKGSSHEDFVDAQETVGPPSPTSSRRPRSRGHSSAASSAPTAANITAIRSIPAGRGAGLKTMEELALENQTLKTLVDKQSKRLSMWETTSQSSYNALAQSFRARKLNSDPQALAHALAIGANAVPPALPSPPATRQPEPHSQTPQQQLQEDPALAARLAELQAQLAAQAAQLNEVTAEREQLARENKKNGEIIGRYRDQWEKLKAGARKREVEKRAARSRQGTGQEGVGKVEESIVKEGEDEDREEDEVEEPGFGKA